MGKDDISPFLTKECAGDIQSTVVYQGIPTLALLGIAQDAQVSVLLRYDLICELVDVAYVYGTK